MAVATAIPSAAVSLATAAAALVAPAAATAVRAMVTERSSQPAGSIPIDHPLARIAIVPRVYEPLRFAPSAVPAI